MDHDHPLYKWVVLSNTTLGTLLATINASIVLISLPAIFRGIGLNPLAPGNVSYLLWMLMGYLVVTAVLVVPFGRLGDMFGRVRIYNLGFVVFTVAAVALSFDPFHLGGGALWLIGWRVVQGVGGAMLMASSSAILTDAFPANQRGMALGVNMVAAVAGSFLGLLIGGFLSEWHWKAIFWVGVPDRHPRHHLERPVAAGARRPHAGPTRLAGHPDLRCRPDGAARRHHLRHPALRRVHHRVDEPMGARRRSSSACCPLVAFCFIELRVTRPMVDIRLFRSASFGMGNLAGLMSSMGRGGLQFMLIIWLQGIWLPLHGYSFESTPLWAGIYMLPMTSGFLVAGPLAGSLSDRFGARPFTVGGMLLMAATFVALRDDPGELRLLGVRGAGVPQRPRRRHLHRAQHRGDHVQRARRPARRRVRCACDVLQRGLVAVDRCVLLADDRRAGPHAAFGDEQRACRRRASRRRSQTMWPTCRRSAACSRRSSATTRSPNCWPRRVRCRTRASTPTC